MQPRIKFNPHVNNFSLKGFLIDAEQEFRKHPFVTQISKGLLFTDRPQHIYCLVCAFKDEKEATQMFNRETPLGVLCNFREKILSQPYDSLPRDFIIDLIQSTAREYKKNNWR